eukprot:TRINITY_DN485_c0_g1_i1.p1 TRINITY_DN485_c0_g1~~TRINITY_DN485_c0_g1_i1.p1  ORF type:complete len:399 (-),score=81.40 TRINITY_DN485_c0_g1_i1:37-1233(-)
MSSESSYEEDVTVNPWVLERFAERYFRSSKKGVFSGKKVPLRKLLVWQKGNLRTALTKDCSNSDAGHMFKAIQMFMGDRNCKKDPMTMAVKVIEKAILGPDLSIRDEIYCQLCKQLTHNPDREGSEYNGWDLLCLCVQYFPPSNKLFNDLMAFFNEYLKLTTDEKLPDYAKFCLRICPKTQKIGARGRVPTVDELNGLLDSPFKFAVFGSTLEEIMEIQEEFAPDEDIPLVLTALAQAVIDLDGEQTEGIFRVPGDAEQVTRLRICIENGEYEIPEDIVDAHIPASLLKLWMRELEKPIIPEEKYLDAIAAAQNESVEDALKIYKKLPKLYRRVVRFVVNYLRHMAKEENVPVTKMSIANLSMVFAPNFLRCPSEDPSVIFTTQKHQQTFVRLLIENL